MTAVFAWIILGNAEIAAEAGTDPTTDVHVGRHRVLAAVAAGAIFNVANALLVVGINLAGLSVAFPMVHYAATRPPPCLSSCTPAHLYREPEQLACTPALAQSP